LKRENKLEITGEVFKIVSAESKAGNHYYRGTIGSYSSKRKKEGEDKYIHKNYIGFSFWVFDKDLVENMDNLRISVGNDLYMTGYLAMDSYTGNATLKFIVKSVSRAEEEKTPEVKPKIKKVTIKNDDIDIENPFA
jgi:hypothetical protein